MLAAIATALRLALLADGTISAAVGTRGYYRLAAESAALPYLVLADVAGGSTNETQRDAFEMLWQVDAVAADGMTALNLGDAARAALHDPDTGLPSAVSSNLPSPWTLALILHESAVYFVEQVERRQYHHCVHTFRIIGTQ